MYFIYHYSDDKLNNKTISADTFLKFLTLNTPRKLRA